VQLTYPTAQCAQRGTRQDLSQQTSCLDIPHPQLTVTGAAKLRCNRSFAFG